MRKSIYLLIFIFLLQITQSVFCQEDQFGSIDPGHIDWGPLLTLIYEAAGQGDIPALDVNFSIVETAGIFKIGGKDIGEFKYQTYQKAFQAR
ncbi:hypothetical protein LCGC14_3045870, partial [marine sediment metagenome]